MRILVHEFATGGGMTRTPVSPSLAREGRAMRDALARDLSDIGCHEVVVSVDPRFPCDRGVVGSSIEFEGLQPAMEHERPSLDRSLDTVDAVWLVAPETGGCHEDMARRIERRGVRLLGSGSEAIGVASDKAGLAGHLTRHGVRYPTTLVLPPEPTLDELFGLVERLDFPIVVKPNHGAGAEGVLWFPDIESVLASIEELPKDGLAQEYVSGQSISVSIIAGEGRVAAITVNSQELQLVASPLPGRFVYRGGVTPLEHPEAGRACELAVSACRSVPGLRGWVGVDLVLGPEGPVVIEINPRLTMSYLGIRRAIEGNVAAIVIDAVDGRIPEEARATCRVRFSECGEIVSVRPLTAGSTRTLPESLTTSR